MNSVARHARTLFTRSTSLFSTRTWELQQQRGIRVKVKYNNLEQALGFVKRVMQSSGIERMIKNHQMNHIKNSEKRVLASKRLDRKIRSQEFSRKLKSILIKKIRGQ